MLKDALIQFCFWSGTLAFFYMFPSVAKVLFSADIEERRAIKRRKMLLKMQQPQRRQPNTEREFGFRKFACVEEEIVYEPVEVPVSKSLNTPEPQTDSSIVQDAISALVILGYKKTEAKKLVVGASNGVVFTDVGELVKATMSRTGV
jgi:hypothetical protein